MKTAKLPDSVFILAEEDMCKNRMYSKGVFTQNTLTAYKKGECSACLLGHLHANFQSSKARYRARVALDRAVLDVDPKTPKCHWPESDGYRLVLVDEFNDAPNRRKSTLAKVWNRAMSNLGYDIPKKYL